MNDLVDWIRVVHAVECHGFQHTIVVVAGASLAKSVGSGSNQKGNHGEENMRRNETNRHVAAVVVVGAFLLFQLCRRHCLCHFDVTKGALSRPLGYKEKLKNHFVSQRSIL